MYLTPVITTCPTHSRSKERKKKYIKGRKKKKIREEKKRKYEEKKEYDSGDDTEIVEHESDEESAISSDLPDEPRLVRTHKMYEKELRAYLNKHST